MTSTNGDIPLNDDVIGVGKSFTTQELTGHEQAIKMIAMAAEGINGPNAFSQESAAYGYIQPNERMVFPTIMRDAIKAQTDYMKTPESISAPFNEHKLNIIQVYTIVYYNYLRLRQGGENEHSAFFMAFYRARLTFLGYLYTDPKDRAVTINEVDWANNAVDFFADSFTGGAHFKERFAELFTNADGDVGRIAAYMAEGHNKKFKAFLGQCLREEWTNIVRHLTFSAQQHAASLYLVFRQHGHHYTPDFDTKYTILWKATTIDLSPHYPGHAKVHRIAVHSFGMKCFHEKFYYNLNSQKLADTYVDRADVAPAGTAIVMTCHAAISAMKTLPMYDSFYATYKTQIDALDQQAGTLKGPNAANAIKFHKNARLFGFTPYKIRTEHAEALAPVAKGFIEAMGEEADLYRQKALDKRANQNPLMVAMMEGVLTKIIRNIARSADLSIGAKKAEPVVKIEGGAAAEEEEEEE